MDRPGKTDTSVCVLFSVNYIYTEEQTTLELMTLNDSCKVKNMSLISNETFQRVLKRSETKRLEISNVLCIASSFCHTCLCSM